MGQRITQKSKADFARRLRQWRIQKNLSQTEAAHELGLRSVRTLQNWEIGRTRPVGFAYDLLLNYFVEKP